MEAQALTWERGRPRRRAMPLHKKISLLGGYCPAGSILADEAKKWHNRFMF